jgi:hemin uptake protein HemP
MVPPPPSTPPPVQTKPDSGRIPPRTVTSAELLGDRRELMIQHDTELYRLRLTANNKLILSK